ncbi:unnamed protein product, partial [Candidula unifasciata]
YQIPLHPFIKMLIIHHYFIIPGAALKYDQSKVYSYSYQTDILLNEVNSKKSTRTQEDVGVQLSIDFDLSTVYKDDTSQIFKLL